MLHEIDWHARAKAVALPNRPFIDGKYVDIDCVLLTKLLPSRG